MNILEFAINMETESETFYRNQAKENENNKLCTVFTALADDERRHAQILNGLMKQEEVELPDGGFSGSDKIFKDYFKSNIKQNLNQLDVYREALNKEKESRELYKSLLNKSKSISETDLFGYLIEQEELHFTIIEDFIFHLEKAESWVESAEFGVREDY